MITDFVLSIWSAGGGWLADTLPAGDTVQMPGAAAVATAIAKLDSLLPVSGLLQVAAGVLAAVLLFVVLRLLLVVRHVLLP